jgi:hypothetical protein
MAQFGLACEGITDQITIENILCGYFEDDQQHKLLFCITVHSIECWLLAHYNPKPPKNPKIKNCEKGLRFMLEKHHRMKNKEFVKDRHFYDKLSEPFLSIKTLIEVAESEPSMKVFIRHLNKMADH